ncbi:UDP-N-acetyl-D-mannosaminuronate dehydrogenase [Aeromicrobium panaciterrae]|uniref:UDP-N-acetyl-D-mannosaminuronate dehydrogenase n=1 Tax=Aeromicrobium panaciterrae TaxID=363861 RepID=A0ABU1UJA7_9ACTN|nr:UDP-N-acetyl-D-mannosaminuronate dehydrogenase [Aeromicrobium panaciterrae]
MTDSFGESRLERAYDYAVVGLGPIGLRIALGRHASGSRVVGLDESATRLIAIGAGVSVLDPEDRLRLEAALLAPDFQLSVDPRLVELAHVVILCVPTSENGGRLLPQRNDSLMSRRAILGRLVDDQVLVLVSTTEAGDADLLWVAADEYSAPHLPSHFGSRLCRGPHADRRAGSHSKGTR